MLLVSDVNVVKDLFETLGFWPWLLMTLALIILFLRLMSTGRQLMTELGLERKDKREKKEKEDKLNSHDSQIQQLTTAIKELSEHLIKIDEKIDRLDEKIGLLETKMDDFDNRITELNTRYELIKEAEKESLYDIIYRKSNYYIHTLHGIPEGEREHYFRLADRYKDLEGNHGLQDTIAYCKKLPRLFSQPVRREDKTLVNDSSIISDEELDHLVDTINDNNFDNIYSTLSTVDGSN